MVNPSDLLPALIKYGDIAHEYLHKHLSADQISDYLDYLDIPTTTHGEAFRLITVEHGHPESVFHVLGALSRINAMCNAAECPNEEPLDPGRAFLVAFSALQAGMMIGAVVDDEGKEGIIKLAKHGIKFAENVGRKPDELTMYLENIISDYNQKHNKFPAYKEVLRILEGKQGQGFIHTVDDVSLEWGKDGTTSLGRLEIRVSEIRKKLR